MGVTVGDINLEFTPPPVPGLVKRTKAEAAERVQTYLSLSKVLDFTIFKPYGLLLRGVTTILITTDPLDRLE